MSEYKLQWLLCKISENAGVLTKLLNDSKFCEGIVLNTVKIICFIIIHTVFYPIIKKIILSKIEKKNLLEVRFLYELKYYHIYNWRYKLCIIYVKMKESTRWSSMPKASFTKATELKIN